MGHVACTEDMRNTIETFVGKPEGDIPLGRTKRRRENIIKIDLKGINVKVWIEFVWPKIGTCYMLL